MGVSALALCQLAVRSVVSFSVWSEESLKMKEWDEMEMDLVGWATQEF
jgi:hypothetical protein